MWLFIEELLAPDWTVTDPSGHVLSRQQVLDEAFVTGDRSVTAMSIDSVHVRVFGDTAVVAA